MNKGFYSVSKSKKYEAPTSASYALTASYALNGGGAGVNPTTGYIPYNTASVFADSSIYFDGTNVGIGTTTPAYKLDVSGSGNFTNGLIVSGSLIQGLAGNIATGEYSHAEGSITKAIGNYSHAEGDNTQAIGDYSHAEGQETIASGSYSHAEGYQTIALANHQHVQGQYNVTSSIPAAFIVGNGTDDSNRSNLIHAAGSEVQIYGSTTTPTINTHQINPITGQDLYIQIPMSRSLDMWTDDNGGELVLNAYGALIQTNATQHTWTFDKQGVLTAPGGIEAVSFTGSVFGYVANTQTASISTSIANLNTFSSSVVTGYVANIQTGSFVKNSQTSSFVTNNQTSSFLTYGSTNVTQTISGSLIINQNLTVLGSSSIQNISSSTLNIGTNIITVNTINPATRFGGLAVIDSGSSPQVSGSLLFDSREDQWIFIHQGTATVTSSLLIMGPETYGNIGGETHPTTNRIMKSVNDEHIGDSNITDTGTIVSINSNVQITGSLLASAGITGSLSGSIFGYVSNTQTGSFILSSQTGSMTVASASYVSSMKAGSGSVVSFTGTPLVSSITFGTAFDNNSYSVTVTGEDPRVWSVQSKSATGFTINSNASQALTGPVYWIATPFN